jgi:ATP-dependent phosphofructokinase / diphosphate-dependent phosphofructokinase
MKTIGIINSGGDAPGINAVIASIIKAAAALQVKDKNAETYKFLGFYKGWEGLLDRDYVVMDREFVRGRSHMGGTFLKTVNKGRFAGKAGAGEHNKIPDEIIDMALESIKELDIHCLIIIGGDGTHAAGIQLAEKGVHIIGVPKTIDNDLGGVAATFGFSTAVGTAAELIEKLHSTATSHERVFVIEAMGRNAGWIALCAGLAGGADAILLPEFPVDIAALSEHIKQRKLSGQLQTIVVVAEGIDTGLVHTNTLASEVKLQGAAQSVMKMLQQEDPEIDIRTMVLGHVQRGGQPNAEDMILSKKYGVGAFTLMQEEKWGSLVTIENGSLKPVPIVDIIGDIKTVTTDVYEYQVAKSLGIYVNG